jgi:outer membrane protein TolC
MGKRRLAGVCAALISAISILAGAAPVYAAPVDGTAVQPQTVEALTVDQAVQAAISANNELKNLGDNYTISDEKLADTKQQYREASEFNELITLSTQIMQAEAALSQNNQSVIVTQEKLRMSIMNFFATVISAENALAIYDQSLAMQKKQLDIAKVKNSLGLMSSVDYQSQVNTYNQKTASRESQTLAINNAFVSLNKTMGVSLNKKYTLMLNLQYQPLGDVNLTGITATAMATDPSVVTQQSNVDVAKYKLDHFDPTVNTQDTETTLQLNLDMAERTLYETQRAAELKVMNAYNKIKEQEVQYSNATLALEALMNQLPVKQTQLELGKITQLDLDSFQAQITQQQESLRSLIVSHEINVLEFKNPSTL